MHRGILRHVGLIHYIMHVGPQRPKTGCRKLAPRAQSLVGRGGHAHKQASDAKGLAPEPDESSYMTLEEMTVQRNALLAARFRGVRTVEIEGRRVTFATDAEMAAAITDLERRIAAAQEGGRKRRILTSASKGL
jgi:hypothetical protein